MLPFRYKTNSIVACQPCCTRKPQGRPQKEVCIQRTNLTQLVKTQENPLSTPCFFLLSSLLNSAAPRGSEAFWEEKLLLRASAPIPRWFVKACVVWPLNDTARKQRSLRSWCLAQLTGLLCSTDPEGPFGLVRGFFSKPLGRLNL